MTELAAAREASPTDDVTSALVHGVVDGERLTHQEIASFFILLCVAGNETTRNAITHGVWGMHLDPSQWELWSGDVEGVTPTAVDELVRWASPINWMRRTAVADTTVGDVPVSAGEKLLLVYGAANRDETVFADPDRLDLRRSPTRTRASAPTVRTSASARTSPAARSRCSSASSSPACPTCASSASPTACAASSSTGSSTCPWRWRGRTRRAEGRVIRECVRSMSISATTVGAPSAR